MTSTAADSVQTDQRADQLADVGLTGLATMGRNLARNLARHGHRVAVHNRTTSKMTALLDEFGDEGEFVAGESLKDLVAAVRTPRVIIVMVQAGEATDAVLDELADLLEDGDIVVDAGNAHVDDTIRREQRLAERGVHHVGMGVSGGEEGALNGPSIMVGGSDESYERLGPLVESIAAEVDGRPCCAHLGTDGAGHFVKMVHNGIEYADMQLIAETFDLLRTVGGLDAAECARVFRGWNETDLASFLIEITADVLDHVDAETGRSFVEVVDDAAEQKGTGRWTVQIGLDLGVPVSAIAEAVFARSLSGHQDQRAAVRDAELAEPGRATDPLGDGEVERLLQDLQSALLAAKVVAYAQGFAMLAAGSDEHDWDVDLGTVAAIWRGGCIIRAQFLDRITEAYSDGPLTTLLTTPYVADAVRDGLPAWRRVVATAVSRGVPVPAFSAALAHLDGLGRSPLPTALVQGLRDDFGSHTYQRVDKDGTFHTQWAADGAEVSAD